MHWDFRRLFLFNWYQNYWINTSWRPDRRDELLSAAQFCINIKTNVLERGYCIAQRALGIMKMRHYKFNTFTQSMPGPQYCTVFERSIWKGESQFFVIFWHPCMHLKPQSQLTLYWSVKCHISHGSWHTLQRWYVCVCVYSNTHIPLSASLYVWMYSRERHRGGEDRCHCTCAPPSPTCLTSDSLTRLVSVW